MENTNNENTQSQETQESEAYCPFTDGFNWEKMQECEYFQGAKNFFNPFENLYGLRKDHQGRTMDYFGYLAHRLTEVKTDHVFNKPLEVRSPGVVIATLVTALISKGMKKKLIRGVVTYFGTAFLFAPEMVNPYYTTYTVKYRFPNAKDEQGYFEKAGVFLTESFNTGCDKVVELYKNQIEASPEPPVSPIEETVVEVVEENQETAGEENAN